MTQTLVVLIDHTARLGWAAGMQFALFGTGLLVPLWLMCRRPASRHFLALVVPCAALTSPLTAACPHWFGWVWLPVPPWLLLVEWPVDVPAVNARSQPRPHEVESPPLTRWEALNYQSTPAV